MLPRIGILGRKIISSSYHLNDPKRVIPVLLRTLQEELLGEGYADFLDHFVSVIWSQSSQKQDMVQRKILYKNLG